MTIKVEATFHMLTESMRYEMYTESGQEELRVYAKHNADCPIRFKMDEIKDLLEFLQYVEEHKYNV